MAEEGYPGIDQTNWQALFAPPGMPQPIRDKIAQAIFAVASDPATQGKMKLGGFEPLPLDGPATERMYRDEIARWAAIIKERGLADRARER